MNKYLIKDRKTLFKIVLIIDVMALICQIVNFVGMMATSGFSGQAGIALSFALCLIVLFALCLYGIKESRSSCVLGGSIFLFSYFAVSMVCTGSSISCFRGPILASGSRTDFMISSI